MNGRSNSRCLRRTPGGFSLVEAMVAIAITSIAGTSLLLGLQASIDSTEIAVEETIAAGLAEQLLEEIAGARYHAVGGNPEEWPLSADSFEQAGAGRERFDDIDDYHDWQASPPEDPYGSEVGQGNDAGGLRHPNFRAASGWFDSWQEMIEVYYVDPNDPSQRLPDGDTSLVRAIHVQIYRLNADGTARLLAERRRVVAYVPGM